MLISFAGVATHYIHSSKLEFVENQLLQASTTDAIGIADFLEDLSEDSGAPFSLAPRREIIDRCFSKSSVEEIVEALKAETDPSAAGILETLMKMSPTSLKITFRQIRSGKTLDFAECFKMEFRLTQRIMKEKDFYEGVRALLIDKDQKPEWNPSSLPNVLDQSIQRHFDIVTLSFVYVASLCLCLSLSHETQCNLTLHPPLDGHQERRCWRLPAACRKLIPGLSPQKDSPHF